MNATLLTQLETAETIPAGSLYMMEAGDGSGTKTVTQETLEQKMGQALKVGDMKELATEEKETLVGAINEAAQSGGGAAVDVLDTREEIEANTQSGKSAGALAVKEMVGAINSNFAYDANGIYGYRRKVDGADTVIPFKKSIEDGEFKSPFCPLTDSYSYVSSSTYDISKLKLTNNDAGYKKMKVEGSLTGKLTSGTSSRDISLWFFAYLANPDGSRGNSRNTQIAKVTATSVTAQSVNFSKEIDLSDLWYAGNATSAYTPVIRLDVRGTYGSGSVQINNMTFYK